MNSDALSVRQVMVLLLTALIAPCIDLLPSLAAQEAGGGGWLLPALVLPVLLVAMWTQSGVFGLPKGFLRSIIYIMYMSLVLVLLVISLRLCGIRLEQIYGTTPARIGTGALLLVAVWMGFGKTAAFARAGEIFYLALAVTVAGTILLGAAQVEPSNLIPESSDLVSLPRAGLAAAGIILNVYPAGVLGNKVTIRENARRKVIGWTIAFCVVLMLVLAVVIGCIGPKLTARLPTPFLIMVQGVGIDGAFQRTEALVAALLILSDFTLIGLLLHTWRGLAEGICPGGWNKWSLFAATLAGAFGWLLLPGTEDVRVFSLTVLPVTGILFGLIFPVIFFVISLLRKRSKCS